MNVNTIIYIPVTVPQSDQAFKCLPKFVRFFARSSVDRQLSNHFSFKPF